MTAAEAVALGAKEGPERAYPMPLHNAPSLHDMLELKRQRRSLDESCSEPQQDSQGAPGAEQPTLHAADGNVAGPPAAEEPPASPGTDGFLTAPSFVLPLLPSVPGEPMSVYFQRLRGCRPAGALAQPPSEPRAVSSPLLDGVYLHKRPIRAPNGASPLAVCGSVFHHVVVLVRQGSVLHTLDYGPANGADVTANILEEAPAKRIQTTSAISAAGDVNAAPAVVAPDAAAAAAGAAQDELPYMYLGAPALDVDHPLVQQLVSYSESLPYHALRNNCIHFADALVRLLTAGAVRGAPLLYDMTCGSVPAVDNPMLMMMQIMLRMPWFVVVDGSPLTAAFLAHWRAGGQGQPPSTSQAQANDPRVGAVSSSAEEDREENNNVAGGAPADAADASIAPAATSPASVDPVPTAESAAVGANGPCPSDTAALACASGGREWVCGPQLQPKLAQQQQEQQEEREVRQEQENDQSVLRQVEA